MTRRRLFGRTLDAPGSKRGRAASGRSWQFDQPHQEVDERARLRSEDLAVKSGHVELVRPGLVLRQDSQEAAVRQISADVERGDREFQGSPSNRTIRVDRPLCGRGWPARRARRVASVASCAAVRHRPAALPEVRRRAGEDHRGDPGACGDRQDPHPPGAGSSAAAAQQGARGGARVRRLSAGGPRGHPPRGV